MAARSKARKRAVDVLYEADVRGATARRARATGSPTANPPVPEHTVRLVEGVAEHAARIDELIDAHARAGRSTGCPTSTARSCAWRSSSCCGPTTSPTPW
jgi:transcription termination factor NusB